MQIIKTFFFSHVSVNKGLIQHVVQHCYNYNITFWKLEIHTIKMRPISACYTSGRGNSLNRALFELRPLHYREKVVETNVEKQREKGRDREKVVETNMEREREREREKGRDREKVMETNVDNLERERRGEIERK